MGITTDNLKEFVQFKYQLTDSKSNNVKNINYYQPKSNNVKNITFKVKFLKKDLTSYLGNKSSYKPSDPTWIWLVCITAKTQLTISVVTPRVKLKYIVIKVSVQYMKILSKDIFLIKEKKNSFYLSIIINRHGRGLATSDICDFFATYIFIIL